MADTHFTAINVAVFGTHFYLDLDYVNSHIRYCECTVYGIGV